MDFRTAHRGLCTQSANENSLISLHHHPGPGPTASLTDSIYTAVPRPGRTGIIAVLLPGGKLRQGDAHGTHSESPGAQDVCPSQHRLHTLDPRQCSRPLQAPDSICSPAGPLCIHSEAVTKHCALGGSIHRDLFSQDWRLEAKSRGVAGSVPSEAVGDTLFQASLSFWGFAGIFSITLISASISK